MSRLIERFGLLGMLDATTNCECRRRASKYYGYPLERQNVTKQLPTKYIVGQPELFQIHQYAELDRDFSCD